MKKTLSIVLIVAIVLFCTGSAFATNVSVKMITLDRFLSDNDVSYSDSSQISIVTKDDGSQYIEVINNLDGGVVEQNIITGIDTSDVDNLKNFKFYRAAPVSSRLSFMGYQLSESGSTKSSTPFVESVGNTGVVVTTTAYYATTYVYTTEYIGTLYAPSGVTGKWTRQSGNNTVSYLDGYFCMRGDLYYYDGATASMVQSNSSYLAEFSKTSPAINTIYSDYNSLGTNYYLQKYGSNGVTTGNGIGYVATINGTSYSYSITF